MSFLVATSQMPGRTAAAAHGWLAANRWLLARRATQAAVLLLFLLGPWAGLWIIKGNLSASLLLDAVPMTDPLLLAQMLAARHWPEASAWIGGAVVAGFYLLVGGRAYCSWVCPLNAVTDAAAWLRRRIGLKTGTAPSRRLRYLVLAALLVAAAVSGRMVWEWVNPVSITQRAIIFGGWGAAFVALGIFVYDLFVAPRGWCGHVCPMGATYALLNRPALLKVAATHRDRCDDCLDCFAVCPEPQVIRPALKGSGTPLILDQACTNCGRCIDVCAPSVFRLTHRFETRRDAS
jgi:ferredoxin-type protein NapH